MIGTRISATLWQVTSRFRASPESPFQIDQRFVVAADPSGADLYDITRSVVLGARARDAAVDFGIVASTRVQDELGGLALATPSDQAGRAKVAIVAPFHQASERTDP